MYAYNLYLLTFLAYISVQYPFIPCLLHAKLSSYIYTRLRTPKSFGRYSEFLPKSGSNFSWCSSVPSHNALISTSITPRPLPYKFFPFHRSKITQTRAFVNAVMKLLGSLKRREFLEYLGDYQLLKKGSVPWSQFRRVLANAVMNLPSKVGNFSRI